MCMDAEHFAGTLAIPTVPFKLVMYALAEISTTRWVRQITATRCVHRESCRRSVLWWSVGKQRVHEWCTFDLSRSSIGKQSVLWLCRRSPRWWTSRFATPSSVHNSFSIRMHSLLQVSRLQFCWAPICGRVLLRKCSWFIWELVELLLCRQES